ncbi:DUF1479-domain-containing protein [Nadsonia fulvescens var. elongata DSM 6958]|uniref:DUF1479-domain-containing protein n=1 Tax=Nadsonia fulvescens var. elongata DSM 6958 TaxID=857566 RepID=A0A1E3PPE7_9ASCO|nr:DUF1479-domain-containing protein [Nadsonia fulvescens var. elongata DSM 6958]
MSPCTTSTATEYSSPANQKKDISAVFPSLNSVSYQDLPKRFIELQREILADGKEELIKSSWESLLPLLKQDVARIKILQSDSIPTFDWTKDMLVDPESGARTLPRELADQVRKSGSAVIKNVIPLDQARQWKFDAEDYIKKNPSVTAFPSDKPTVYELYWSKSQLEARSHPELLAAQSSVMDLWHTTDESITMVTSLPLSYADRLRIRHPGDKQFTLGPHIDAGSIERWEDPDYRSCYDDILKNGNWKNYDAFDYKDRLHLNANMYKCAGGCTMFRMFQGWLAMSSTGPTEGTLKVFPLIKYSTVYVMLRPFFAPKDGNPLNIEANNWEFVGPTNVFPNTSLGAAQELNPSSHPHLELEYSMVPLPKVNPGDYVIWHCDSIHSVESEHNGLNDSSVMYIPATPLCEVNYKYLAEQKKAFLQDGAPPPDFPNPFGPGESGFVGRVTQEVITNTYGLKAMGLGKEEFCDENLTLAQKELVKNANDFLFT